MSANDSTSDCTLEQARAAKTEALGAFRRLAEVTGIGITRIGKGYGLKVNLQEAPAREVILPESIKGIPVRVEVVGPLKKRSVI